MGIFNFFRRTKIKETFHANGKLKSRVTYKSKNKHGKEISYHDNGVLQSECEWVNGLQNGEIISYDNKGNKVKQSFLVDGNYHGTQKEWWPNGQLKADRIMKNDKIFSEKEYDSNGELQIKANKDISSKTKKKTTSKIKNSSEKDDMYLCYAKAQESLNNKEYKLAYENFDKVINILSKKTDIPPEIMSMTAFASSDMSISFSLIDVYHNRGCAKFYISDDSSIDDFTEAIKIHENYENAYYMRGSAYFVLLEDWQKAITDIKKYLTFSPDDNAGNKLLLVLEEIKENSEKINTLYTKALDDYSEGKKMLSFVDDSKNDIGDEVVDLKKGTKLMKSCVKSLDKAYELFSQKNRPNIYLKSHSFSLFEILFKKLQCSLMLQKSDSIMNQCLELYKISKGLFKPHKSELGAKIYYTIVEKANQNRNDKILSRVKKNVKSKLRVKSEEIYDVGIVSYYKNKPFNGILYSLHKDNLIEELEMVDGLKNGIGKLYSKNGEIICSVNFIDDEFETESDEEKYQQELIRLMLDR